jgi:asparagine synthase (glutamine-hydrolysing)
MCGIAGILRPQHHQPQDVAHVETMLGELIHRGPDDHGLEHLGPAVLGHRRLSILDLSPAGHQPMVDGSGRYWITFNGEIYNFPELRDMLGLDEGSLRSSSDTEVLLEAWKRWGPDALNHCVGQFAFGLLDTQEDELFLVRDRFGEKPLFWHQGADGSVAFASSLGALTRVPWVPSELDADAVQEYVTLRYVVAPRTVVRDVRKLPGGHYLKIKGGKVEEHMWWDPRFREPVRRSKKEAIAEFGEKWEAACKRTLISDVPVGLLLSDGIDSHAVRAGMQTAGVDVPSFTYRMSDQPDGLGDIPPSSAGTFSQDLVVSPGDRVEKMREAFGAFTEPVGDGASLATWFLIRGAREHATVFLCGHGGDEVAGGYRLSQDRFRLQMMRRLGWAPLRWTGSMYDRFHFGLESAQEKRRQMRSVSSQLVPQVAHYLIHRPLPVDDVTALTGRPPTAWLSSIDSLYAGSREGADDIDRMQEVMLKTFLGENILSFADSVAMTSSAELRMPFLDRDLVGSVLETPSSHRVSTWPGRANTKLILRWWAKGHVHESVVKQRKKTFNFGNLPTMLEAYGPEIKGYVLDSAAVRRALPGVEKWVSQDPTTFRGPWEGTLWGLITLGIWCEANSIT